MLFFNFHLVFFLIFVFVQGFVSEMCNIFKQLTYVHFNKYDTASVKVKLGNIPGGAVSAQLTFDDIIYKDKHITVPKFEFEDITLSSLLNDSLLAVRIFLRNGDEIQKKVIKFRLDQENKQEHCCSGHCTIVIDDWKREPPKRIPRNCNKNENGTFQQTVELKDFKILEVQKGDVVKSAVVFRNTPGKYYSVALTFNTGSSPYANNTSPALQRPEHNFHEFSNTMNRFFHNSRLSAKLFKNQAETNFDTRNLIGFEVVNVTIPGSKKLLNMEKCSYKINIIREWKQYQNINTETEQQNYEKSTHNPIYSPAGNNITTTPQSNWPLKDTTTTTEKFPVVINNREYNSSPSNVHHTITTTTTAETTISVKSKKNNNNKAVNSFQTVPIVKNNHSPSKVQHNNWKSNTTTSTPTAIRITTTETTTTTAETTTTTAETTISVKSKKNNNNKAVNSFQTVPIVKNNHSPSKVQHNHWKFNTTTSTPTAIRITTTETTTTAAETTTTTAETTISAKSKENNYNGFKTVPTEFPADSDPDNVKYIVPPIVFLIALIVAFILYRRYKSKLFSANTYQYVTPLTYADLQLGSPELYEIPRKDYTSFYTRIIGVLKPK